MAYDENLARRIRDELSGTSAVVEKKMFGGLCFMVGGHMCCGVVGDELMVRIGPDRYEVAVAEPHARPMDFTGRPLRGMVYVARGGCATTRALRAWVQRGLEFVRSLPPR